MSNYKKTVLGFLVCLLGLAVMTIVNRWRLQPPGAGNSVLDYFQWGLLVLCAMLGVVHFGLKSREVGKNFSLVVLGFVPLGVSLLSSQIDRESDPRILASVLLIAVLALNVALLLYVRIRKRKTSISGPAVKPQSS